MKHQYVCKLNKDILGGNTVKLLKKFNLVKINTNFYNTKVQVLTLVIILCLKEQSSNSYVAYMNN